MTRPITVGIDASNLRLGGGRTHLIELLQAAEPSMHGIVRVVVWGSQSTLDLLAHREWLIQRCPPELNRSLLHRSLWQWFTLSKEARKENCAVLFVPGGSYAGTFHPVVTMSQNLLPFEWRELRRYGLRLISLKLLVLRWIQTQSLRRSEGVIFLTNYGRESVEKVTGTLRGEVCVIPHGLSMRFSQPPREQLPISDFHSDRMYRILYVSIIDQYKHQWQVVKAVARLRDRTGWPIQLELVGPAHTPAMHRLNQAIARNDSERKWIKYRGWISYDDMHQTYLNADLSLWASSCETFGIILLESMAAGLPIASSNRGAMPEVLGDVAVYFDPENPAEIAEALARLIGDPGLRRQKAETGFKHVQQFSWRRCSDETLGFVASVSRGYESVKN